MVVGGCALLATVRLLPLRIQLHIPVDKRHQVELARNSQGH